MATDYRERERVFIDGLKENTGRDLAEWMQAISAQPLTERNDIIDWLRHQGLMFSKASWLERIHHNGGRAIYADLPAEAVRPRPRRRETRASEIPEADHAETAPAPAAPAERTPVPSGDLESLLAKAKAYRPLAQHLIARIRAVQPAAVLSVGDGAVFIGAPETFAALGISGKELRLHLALGDHPFDEIIKKGQAGGGLGKGEALSHMLVLTDARQVDERLMELIARAAGNPPGGTGKNH